MKANFSKYYSVAILLLVLPQGTLANLFMPKDLEIFAHRGVKFYSTSYDKKTHKDLYAIPNTNDYKGWQITQIGKNAHNRTPVQVCRHGADCFTGWIPAEWARVTNKKPASKLKAKKQTENKVANLNEHYPDQERSCLGIAENKLNDFAIRSVLKKNNRFYKGEFLNCGLPAGVQLCITDANNSTGRRSWVEALLNQENYSKLSDSCQRNLNNAVRDGVISKTDEGEYVVSIYTNSQHIETIENPEVVNYLQKQTSEANSGTCENCLNSTSVFSEIMKVAEETFNITTQVRDQVQHPEGWPISADGYSYPLDPSKSYITTPRGLRRLKGYTDYHEGYDFGTFNKSLAVHAMKGGKIYKSKFKCFANSSENCNGGYGNQVVIEHDDGTKMYYSHLNANCEAKVENGQKVKVGDKIGCVGDTGRGDTHLDVRLLKRDGNAYNIVHSKFKGLYNNQTVTLRVATDFIEIESKLQSLYSHFLVKSDFKNRDSLRVALSKRWSEIDELEGKI